MGFFSAVKKIFGGSRQDDVAPSSEAVSAQEPEAGAGPAEPEGAPVSPAKPASEAVAPGSTSVPAEAPVSAGISDSSEEDEALTLRLREAEPRLSVWLGIILEGVDSAGDLLWQRLAFLLRALDAPQDEVRNFVDDFRAWLDRMEYRHVEEFRSELQYRLALALDLEDEEDERSRLFLKISEGLSRTREQFARRLDTLFASHGELDDAFWEELEELFIMADLGYEPSLELVERLKERARREKSTRAEQARELLLAELEEIFRAPRRISAVNPPEVVLMIGVNGVGKTTTIAKLAHRARMQGKKVMIAAADTFRAAAIEQLQVWAERVGALFHARPAGSDPASVAFEAVDRAVKEGVDVLFVDTAGRLQTKVNLMEELTKIRQVLGKKHSGAPHRSILVLDATTGQNALSQTKLFKEAAGVDELILTKLDGTAKGGVAIAVAMQHHLPITFVGLGEKMEDLRPFNGADYARALLGEPAAGTKAV
ncbi:MAG: signal recognition particle-docking protein FtsY [Desulfovibrio sp.]|uniref:signal recognition particle-docking protein FtsY n=1 Tax=Desulfovibrio sp. TaxID=885 RepID=UPI0025828380|nr:signal recognition particle-docking protein FtsY [Desulfovibrio sp.]MCD7983959.1 signal recognition particle-docking protein FtsY [Desulfovibrio sp.]